MDKNELATKVLDAQTPELAMEAANELVKELVKEIFDEHDNKTVEQLANEGRRIVCIYRDGTVYKQRRFSEAILRTRLQWNADWNCWSTRDLPKEEEFQQVMCFERCE
jgi:hypothetical protein